MLLRLTLEKRGKNLLEVKDVYAGYASTEVLHGVSFSVRVGHITTLIGANGAGKTTIMNCLMGVVIPTAGEITLLGEAITGLKPTAVVRKGLTLIPEGRHIFPQMTVLENLDMGAYLRNDVNGVKEDFEWALQLFPALKERLQQLAGTLSGGEQQMLAFGRALMAHPSILLMDEPSMGLAPIIVENIFNIILKIKEMGKTVLLVEQNAALALEIADEAYVVELGKIVLSGTGGELAVNPQVESAYLGM
jgi:branched-chain amino acid transport system ATP-binding protein